MMASPMGAAIKKGVGCVRKKDSKEVTSDASLLIVGRIIRRNIVVGQGRGPRGLDGRGGH